METRKLGTPAVSVVGLGCNNFGGRLDQERTSRVIDASLAAGINFFDTADVYGGTHSEELVGKALGARRSSVLIATKFGIPLDAERKGGAHPNYIRRAVEDSLRRLGSDYIDLYQLHRPDPEVPLADTLGAPEELRRAGKVRDIGCSSFSVEQLREAEAATQPGAARFACGAANTRQALRRYPAARAWPMPAPRSPPAFAVRATPPSPRRSGALRRAAATACWSSRSPGCWRSRQ